MKFLLYITSCIICFKALALELYEKKEIINNLEQAIEQQYVLDKKIPLIKSYLANISNSSQFQKINSADDLAYMLDNNLKGFDKHFTVQYISKNNPINQSPVKENWFTKLERNNSGFNKVEILTGNIGYIDFWGFDRLSMKSKTTVASVMQFIANTDALIIDLRSNGGGSAEMVQLISSYFLPHKTLLNTFYTRNSGQTTKFWTFDNVERLFPENFPIYILTSPQTFSAAEEFAYNLKHLKRATIIGEESKGGANPWQWFDIGHGYRAGIPISMAINPVTKTNWEAIGVKPNIQIEASKAYSKAYALALHNLESKIKNKFKLEEIKQKLTELSDW